MTSIRKIKRRAGSRRAWTYTPQQWDALLRLEARGVYDPSASQIRAEMVREAER